MTGTATLLDGTTVSFSGIESIICFAAGTFIDTNLGPRLVEDLRPGDLLRTRDNGYQPVVWRGQSYHSGLGDLAPVCFDRALVGGERDLLVSPQHRMLHSAAEAELLFNSADVLVPAHAMLDDALVYRVPCSAITYLHVLTRQHDVIYANGFAAESFFPGLNALAALSSSQQNELIGQLANWGLTPACYRTAHPCLTASEYRSLSQYNPPELMVPKFALGPSTAVPPVDVVT